MRKLMNVYVDRVIRVREWLDAILDAASVDEQRRIYDGYLRDRFWTRTVKFAMGRDTTLSMVGVPKAQRQQVERDYEGGIVKFVMDCVEAVFAQLPMVDNYFWRVYLTGQYTPACCPEYLKAGQLRTVEGGGGRPGSGPYEHRAGLSGVARAEVSRFVLLDHMDWLSNKYFPLLEAEWQAILNAATDDARFLWRSGGLRTDFVDRVQVRYDGRVTGVG